jgi:7-carboxy-7-deazaguanine synthase
MTDPKLAISEVFPAWQGEGPAVGQRCVFIRLSGCNLRCGLNGGWKCDTPYTWDWTGQNGRKYLPGMEIEVHAPDDLYQYVMETYHPRLVVITGGEPLLQQRALLPLVTRLNEAGVQVHVETNGTKVPDPDLALRVQLWMVSPKLSNSGNLEQERIRPDALTWYAAAARGGMAAFKFVLERPGDIEEAGRLTTEYGVPPRAVWGMPEGTSAESILAHVEEIAPAVAEHGWNLTLRQQVLMYGTRRGV